MLSFVKALKEEIRMNKNALLKASKIGLTRKPVFGILALRLDEKSDLWHSWKRREAV